MSFKRMIYAVETHSGEPMRVITGGIPNIPGETVYEQMCWLQENDDQIRMMMVREPRGYPPLYCNIIVPPKHPKASAGFIIMGQTEYPLMSGGNTISVATVLLETGMLPMTEPITEFFLEAPAGLIGIKATCENGKVTGVEFENVPSIAPYLDAEIDVPELGKIKVDVGWSGDFKAVVDARQIPGLELSPENGSEIARISSIIRKAASEQLEVQHPEFPESNIVAGIELWTPAGTDDADWQTATTCPSGEFDWQNPSTWTGNLDRCPCGTGTCCQLAIRYAKGDLELNEPFRNKGILGTVYVGKAIREIQVGQYKGIVPTVKGQSWITGYSTWVLDPTDPLPNGFTIGDIWG